MPRLMYDSTSPWDIPRDAEMVAYYVDGRYAWPQTWLDMFPNAKKVSISAIGARTAQVGDVEVGCIWPPANAVPWVLRARADGYDPTIYVNERNDWAPVRREFQARGVPEPHYWVANYDGVRVIPAGAVAKQFAHPHDGDGVANRPWETGKHYDLSIVADFWPGVDERAPGSGAAKEEDDDMGVFYRRGESTGRCFIVQLDCEVRAKWYIPTLEIAEVISALTKKPFENVSDWALDYIGNADGPPPIPVDVDEDAIAAAVSEGVIPAVVKALQDLPTEGLSTEETIEAVREALRRGTNG